MTGLFDDLQWRGLIAHSTDPEALKTALDDQQIAAYVGFDPSAPSLHMGNLLQLITIRRLQAAGHTPYLLVGGSTGLIGDPRQTSERNLNPKDLVASWVERIRSQVEGFIDFDGPNGGQIVNNYDWTAQLSVLDFLRDVGKHFSISRMLAREIVKSRLEEGISFTEFAYVLLQSYDYLTLHQRYGVSLQTGGSDQFGNMTAGADLIRRVTGDHVHVLATPLITKSDGSKYGKTAGGAIWLDPAMTSPYQFHQFFLNAEDDMVVGYVKAFTNRSREEIEELARLTVEEPQRRAAQRVLADDLTDLVHSPQQRQLATQAAQALFGAADLRQLDAATLAGVAAELTVAEVPTVEALKLTDALVAAQVVKSKGEARRAIQEGGAYVNNERYQSIDHSLSTADLLPGGYVVLRRGKKTVGLLQVTA
ncbi:MAG: tyrosine--tRNA ligase [Propionibacteriaceae bacterium]|jgi:tyrosyl-tRNA synthetase|nr:tyrosine--tRNA ligase [Propionibacteriaceae bacterium]